MPKFCEKNAYVAIHVFEKSQILGLSCQYILLCFFTLNAKPSKTKPVILAERL